DQNKDHDSQTAAAENEDDDDDDDDDDDEEEDDDDDQTAEAEEERVREIAVAKLCAMLGRRQPQLIHTSLEDWVEAMRQPGHQQSKVKKAAIIQTALPFEPEKRKDPPGSDTREPKRLKVEPKVKLKLSQPKPPEAELVMKLLTTVNNNGEGRQLRSRGGNRG
ncbi:hypothetical protein N8T08_005717, partial [Aspergillus melleus]